MTQPRHHSRHVMSYHPRRYCGPVDQNHRQMQRPRSVKLGPRAVATGILGNDQVDAAGFQQSQIFGLAKGSARDDGFGPRQRQKAGWRVDESQQILMPGLCDEGGKHLPPYGQKYADRFFGKRRNSGGNVGDMGPVISVGGYPWRAFEGTKRNAGRRTGNDGISAHPCGKGVGRVDQMGDAFLTKIVGQTGDAAKTTDPRWQGLFNRIVGASGIGKNRINPFCRQFAGQSRGFGCAAQKKDACHG